MPRRLLDRIRAAIRNGDYDMTGHAIEEMAEDEFDIIDVEASIMRGKLIKTERNDPRGTRYTVHGTASGGTTFIGTVGRYTNTGRYLIITVYEVTEP